MKFQLIAGLAVLVYWICCRLHICPPFAFESGFLIAILVVVFSTQGGTVLLQTYRGQDVTLSQRVFEGQQVLNEIPSAPVGNLFGRGLGATVDLSQSPDSRTLLSSGRDLMAVNDVHVLFYDWLMKRGYIGIVWLVGFIALASNSIKEKYRRSG